MDCGLCCDGTLFSSVSLDAAGLVAAREHRLPVLETADSCKLEMPCPALRSVLCAIYEERSEECSDFACELRLRVEEGEQGFEAARKLIGETRAVRSRVTERIGDTPWWVARRSALEAERSGAGWAEENADFIADLNQLEKLVRRYFWG